MEIQPDQTAADQPPDQAWLYDPTTTAADQDEVQVLISAIEHYSYCPRQCGLIHIEQTFEENLFTIRGRIAHERVDTEEERTTRGVRTMRSIPLWSYRFGLRGKLDLLEFRPEGPYPVEYKSGRRHGRHADLQLCAQALCLEEMLGVPVHRGAIYYAASHKRHEVVFDDSLRQRTLAAVEGVREMLRSLRLPAAPNDERCPNCSLIDACLPRVVGQPARLRGLQGALFHTGIEPADSD